MKKITLLIFVIITSNVVSQNTKKIDSHEFSDGTVLNVGDEIEFIHGKNPVIDGEYLWSYEGQKKRIVTTNRINKEMDGKRFQIERLFMLKGIKPKDEGIIASFLDEGRMIYVFVNQSIKYQEIKPWN